jgi:hypothetical protein
LVILKVKMQSKDAKCTREVQSEMFIAAAAAFRIKRAFHQQLRLKFNPYPTGLTL